MKQNNLMQYKLEFGEDFVFENWLKQQPGMRGSCPCCDRHAQIYKRSFNAPMANSLIRLYKAGGNARFIKSKEVALTGDRVPSNFTTAKIWGLIFAETGEADTGAKTKGKWKLTPHGINFVTGGMKIPKYAHIYLDEALKFETELITIQEALASGGFSYTELMKANL